MFAQHLFDIMINNNTITSSDKTTEHALTRDHSDDLVKLILINIQLSSHAQIFQRYTYMPTSMVHLNSYGLFEI